ncbi:MAG: GntR family transcriptional regulator [Acidimicrobiales bacterium]
MSPTTAPTRTFAVAEPAYLTLADALERDIATLEPGARVASEHELVETHGVSRLTARAALQEVERRFLVRRVRGSGTFVARRIDYPIGAGMPPSASEMVRRAGGVPSSTLVSIRTRRPGPDVREALDLDTDERIVAITRAGRVDDLPASYGTSHLPLDLVDGIADHLGDDVSIYRTLSEHFDLAPVRQWARAEQVVVPADVAPHLGLEGRPLVWRLESCNVDRRLGRPVELSSTWLRADVYRVSFELGKAD